MGSAARCSDTIRAEAAVSSPSSGSRSSRVTFTPGSSTSEKPAPVTPGRGTVEPVTVSFIQRVGPAGASIRSRSPSTRRNDVAEPFSVSTRTSVGAARTRSGGAG